MNHKEYENMEKFEKTYWWHRGRLYLVKRLVEEYLPNGNGKLNILEIGSGTGETVQFLSNFGTVTGIDVAEKAVEFCKNKGLKNIIHGNVTQMDLSQKYGTFDAIFALDTLEHIQDDVLVLKKIKELLKPGGILFLTVPAHKFLWSEHDEALHHKRRYHSLELIQKLKDASLTPIRKSYFVVTAFLPIVFFRMVGNIFGKSAYPKTSYVELPKVLNDFAINVLKVEARLLQKISLPPGATLVAVAKKSGND